MNKTQEWEIRDTKETSTGVYYHLNVIGKNSTIVSVKATRFDTLVCLTCDSISCEHSTWLRRKLDQAPRSV